MEEKVLITGSTGVTGSKTIDSLLAMDIPVRAMVHKSDQRSAVLAAKGVEIVHGDLTDFNSVSAALKGITKAYFIYPVTVPGILEATAYFARAATEEKLNLIVNLSQRTSRREAKSHAAQNHWIAEKLFDRSGVPVTHLRPTLFAEWLLYFAGQIRENSSLISPYGDARYASIAGEDIARVAASILAKPEGHAGMTYPLFGPAALTQYEVADILSTALLRKITYVPMAIDAFAGILRTHSTPYFVQHVSAVAQDFRDGLLEGNNNLIKKLFPFDIVCVMRQRTPLTKSILSGLPNLKMIVSTGEFNSSIAYSTAAELGISISNTGYVSNGAPELTWALLMSITRHIPAENASVISGGWQTTVGTDLRGKTIGIVGLGNIGKQIARIALAFDMKVLAWSQELTRSQAKAAGASFVSKHQLFRESDFISVHLVLSDRSRDIIKMEDMILMKPTAYLINTSRGPLIREKDLIELLKNRKIKGAALDVFDTEPLPADHPFRMMDNVLVTPHIGYVTEKTYEVFYRDTVRAIEKWVHTTIA